MGTTEFFKQYPNAKQVHIVGKQMFTDAHRGEALIHAKLTGQKMTTVENDAPGTDPTEIKSNAVLAENIEADAKAKEQAEADAKAKEQAEQPAVDFDLTGTAKPKPAPAKSAKKK